MGFLSKLFGLSGPVVRALPSGSFTVSRDGEIMTCTVSSAYPRAQLVEIAREVLRQFQEARQAQLPLAGLSVHFASLSITAREIQSGAVIFLSPKNALATAPQIKRKN